MLTGGDFMFCRNCGKEVNDGSVFCTECGAKFDENMSAKGKVNVALVVVLIAVVVAVVAIVGILMFVLGKKSGEVNTTSTVGQVEELKDDSEDNVVDASSQDDKNDEIDTTVTEDDVTLDDNEDIEEEDLSNYPDIFEGNDEVSFIGDKGRDDVATRKLVAQFVEAKKINPDDILTVCCSDFDQNKEYEAFIFVGSYNDDEMFIEGTPWFVSNSEIYELDPSYTGGWYSSGRFVDCGKRQYYLIDEYYVTGSLSHIWSVYEGQAKLDDMSMQGYIEVAENGDFYITSSTYDATYDGTMKMMLGHSWKLYYGYYDEKADAILEYKGGEVDIDSLDKLCGTSISDDIKYVKGYALSAYYRNNGIVNINYLLQNGEDAEFRNATWNLNTKEFEVGWDSGDTDFEKSDQSGIYESAWTSVAYDKPNCEELEEERVSLYVYSPKAAVSLPGSIIIYGTLEEDDNAVVPTRAFVVDNATTLEQNGGIDFGGRTDDMTALDWVESLYNASEQNIENGYILSGVYDIRVTGSHVDHIYGQYWWD